MGKTNKVILLMAAIVLLAVSAGCTPNKPDTAVAPETVNTAKVMDTGTIQGSTYKNDYLGLTMEIPENWSVQSKETKQEIQKAGKDLVANGDSAKKAALERSMERVVSLLALSKYPMGTPDKENAMFSSLSEKVSMFPGVKTGKDYLLFCKKQMENSKVKFTFNEITTEKIDGIDFDVLECKTRVQEKQVSQKYYAAIFKDYAFAFILTYGNPDDLAVLNKIIGTMKFAK